VVWYEHQRNKRNHKLQAYFDYFPDKASAEAAAPTDEIFSIIDLRKVRSSDRHRWDWLHITDTEILRDRRRASERNT
jgi:hypothetical protein